MVIQVPPPSKVVVGIPYSQVCKILGTAPDTTSMQTLQRGERVGWAARLPVKCV